jgi:lysophospholipase L1-like esterase
MTTPGPFDRLNTKRRSDTDKKVILGIGDSTFIGYGSGNDGGWLTRLGKLIGAADNINVYWKQWGGDASGKDGEDLFGWSPNWKQIWTKTAAGTKGDLYIYDGAIGGHDLLAMISWMNNSPLVNKFDPVLSDPVWSKEPYLSTCVTDRQPLRHYVNVTDNSNKPTLRKTQAQIDELVAQVVMPGNFVAEQPDLIFQASGVNDYLQPSFVPPLRIGFSATRNNEYLFRYDTLIGLIQSQMPSVPLVITSMNNWKVDTYSYLFVAEAVELGISSSKLPLNPSIQQSTKYSDVWMMDTKQATTVADVGDLWHLTAAGNQKQAEWMFKRINGSAGTGSGPDIITTALRPDITTTPTLSNAVLGSDFSMTLDATGTGPFTWLLVNGKGSLPRDLTLNGNVISGRITEAGPYAFSILAVGQVTNLSDEQPFSGTIESKSVPFSPDIAARVKYRGIGNYYPTQTKLKVGGVFRPAVLRN